MGDPLSETCPWGIVVAVFSIAKSGMFCEHKYHYVCAQVKSERGNWTLLFLTSTAVS